MKSYIFLKYYINGSSYKVLRCVIVYTWHGVRKSWLCMLSSFKQCCVIDSSVTNNFHKVKELNVPDNRMSTKHTKHQIIFVKKGLLEIRLKIRLNRHKGEAATRGVLCKMVFSEISQNSQENNCARVSFLTKLQACNFI